MDAASGKSSYKLVHELILVHGDFFDRDIFQPPKGFVQAGNCDNIRTCKFESRRGGWATSPGLENLTPFHPKEQVLAERKN